jgi:endoglucanase
VSVQEEVGLRGARTSSFGIEPDVGVALDITVAADLPGSDKNQNPCSLGKGVSIGVMDSHSISDPRLVRRFRELAESNGIEHQLEVAVGGTDAAAMQMTKSGVPVITISPPVRYVHTSNEMALSEDVDATVDLMVSFLEAVGDVALEW